MLRRLVLRDSRQRQPAAPLALACLMLGLGAAGPPRAGTGGLTVVDVEPPPRILDANLDSPIVVHFDRPVDRASIVPLQSFWAFGKWSGTVFGTFGFSNGDRTVTLTPDEPFSAGENVMVILSHDIRAADGSFLRAAGYSFQFWTIARPADLSLVELGRLTTRSSPSIPSRSYGGIGSDVDSDGYLDVSLVNEDTADLRVFLNQADGSGSFDPFLTPTFPVGDGASPSEPSDFDRDGHVDICVANDQADAVSILLGVGNGSFGVQQFIPVGDRPRGVVALDVDGDGDTDVVNTAWNSSNMSLMLNDGSGNFGAPAYFDGGGTGEWGLAVGDMNEDGILDLVLGDRNDEEIRVLAGDGDGTFTQLGSNDATGRLWMVVLGDLNGDRHEDVVTITTNTSDGVVLFGDGAGNLSAPQTYATDTTPLATDLGDLDGDGDLDWITSSFDGGSWWVFLNDGTGQFTFHAEIPAQQAASCALIIDFDNDRDLDLALTDELEDEIIFLRQGTPDPCTAEQLGTWYRDADMDGFGDRADLQFACTVPGGFVGDDSDCDDASAQLWAAPGEVEDLQFEADKQTLSWTAPAEPGAQVWVYDTLRATDPSDFDTADCVESDDGSDSTALAAASPAVAGEIFHYLVRAENGCPAGEGLLGYRSGGVERTARSCP